MTRSEALEYFREELKDGKCSDTCPICNAMEWAIKALEEPEIVRCKECKFFNGLSCSHGNGLDCITKVSYCSFGRRKANE